ncbi:hypothetical protein AMC94_13445 [Pseudomonas amygdali pv. aesculi]|nr:hypothetical protein AL041_28430 [Pseudomonas amygdali pv. aesculi]KWT17448.1 hypothetical protein AL043_07360 [Pseudomonas amygdali pv. aesculi]KWT18435.1 hypothetical protein AL042_28870 [Pseudomonas amygdali pv. aesculi]KWT21968.1 hypothetical protein AL044_01285 [Pseudomonas amygdali pv. aesculi]KWT40695.1 hypothetical protein AL045_14975 [Pseudomonas amygdali pv. aesculi]
MAAKLIGQPCVAIEAQVPVVATGLPGQLVLGVILVMNAGRGRAYFDQAAEGIVFKRAPGFVGFEVAVQVVLKFDFRRVVFIVRETLNN